LVSGNLGYSSLQFIKKQTAIHLICVFTDRSSKIIQNFCKKNHLSCFIGNPRTEKVASYLEGLPAIDVLFSINYLFLIDRKLLDIPRLYALNIHGSLLPKYRGRTPHVWAIIQGETKTGITVHKIDEGTDTGDILLQEEVEIDPENTGAEVLEKFHHRYPVLILRALNLVKSGNEVFRPQDNSKATYFGKRVPEDGLIDWNWEGERIRNWIRAQAHPYPGAFTYIEKKKFIINKVQRSDYPVDPLEPNGKVLSASPFLIKTTDSIIELIDYTLPDGCNEILNDKPILGL
jgi:methionyl-tRNA formyltransferase